MSAKSFGTLFERLGRRAGMPFTIFPHMLRHACGSALANAGHDTRALQAWLGHKNIQHTVRYTGRLHGGNLAIVTSFLSGRRVTGRSAGSCRVKAT